MNFLLGPFKHVVETVETAVVDGYDAITGHSASQQQLKSSLKTSDVVKDHANLYTPEIPRVAYISAIVAQQTYNEPSKRIEYIDLHYKYYPEYSNDRIAVYLHIFLTNQAIIGIRGTRITDEDDIEADLDIIFSKDNKNSLVNKTQQETDDILEKLENRFDIETDNVVITGHSLGALIACYSSYRKYDTGNAG